MRHLVSGAFLWLALIPAVALAGGSPEQSAANEGRPADDRPRAAELSGIRPVRGFTTDFSRAIVPDDEIIAGGPPKDGIPPIDAPRFLGVDEVDWLAAGEPVLVAEADRQAHIYPLQILTYHEIVNDIVGSTPLAVTYCPLCNTGIAFRREFEGAVLDFGTTGRLRYSNLIMYDRQTESWWQQATGEGLVGAHAGERLEFYPVMMLPWDRAAARYPDARVLSRETGHSRAYGTNPYAGYDTAATPFLYRGPDAGEQYNPMTRVVQVVVGSETAVVPYTVLSERRVVQEEVGESSVVVIWEPGTASALDTRAIRDGRDVGSANAFHAVADGRQLSFIADGNRIVDEQTGSVWDITGRAIEGLLEGARLEPVVGIQHFWFSSSAFDTEMFR